MGFGGTYIAVPAQIAVQPFSPEFAKISGRWYCSNSRGDAPTPVVITEDRLQASPLIFAQRTSIDRLGVRITTAQVGANIRLALYAATSATDPYPGALLAQSGAISAATTGDKTYIVALTLPAGIYWIVVCTGTVGVQCYSFDATMSPAPLGAIDMDGNAAANGYSPNAAFGVLPDPYPAAADPEVIDTYGMVRVA